MDGRPAGWMGVAGLLPQRVPPGGGANFHWRAHAGQRWQRAQSSSLSDRAADRGSLSLSRGPADAARRQTRESDVVRRKLAVSCGGDIRNDIRGETSDDGEWPWDLGRGWGGDDRVDDGRDSDRDRLWYGRGLTERR